MLNYYYIDEEKYNEVTTFENLKRVTNNFEDCSKLFELSDDDIKLFLDPKLTRIIIDGMSYVISKNFINISSKENFIILRRY